MTTRGMHATTARDMCQRDCMRRYFVNSRCGWYLKAFEGAFEISMTCLVVFSLVVSIVLDVMHVIICTSQLPGEPAGKLGPSHAG